MSCPSYLMAVLLVNSVTTVALALLSSLCLPLLMHKVGNLLANVAHPLASTSRLFAANSQLCLSIMLLPTVHLPIQCLPLSGWRYFFLPFLTSYPHPLSIPSVTQCIAPCSCSYPLPPLLFLLAVLCSEPYHHILVLPHISCFYTIAFCFMLVRGCWSPLSSSVLALVVSVAPLVPSGCASLPTWLGTRTDRRRATAASLLS